MRIRVLSDLHREFGPTEIPRIDCDLILLAGDIGTKPSALPWIREFCGDTPTAYICGNHEFYGDKLPRVTERLQSATAGTNIHVLEDSFFAIGEWWVYGCTLWTDMALQDDWNIGAAIAGEAMNDYKRIRNSERCFKKLTAADTRRIHCRSLQRLNEFFTDHDAKRTLVVTHHAPSIRSLPDGRRGESISCAYASRLDDFVLAHQPPLWVHGHIHHSNDYKINSTRILANPQGYPEDPNVNFVRDLTIEV
jgi:hypothetical protein